MSSALRLNGLRGAITLSVLLHIGLFLVPEGWWNRAVGGGGPSSSSSPAGFVVSLFPAPQEEAPAVPVPNPAPAAASPVAPPITVPSPAPSHPRESPTPVPATGTAGSQKVPPGNGPPGAEQTGPVPGVGDGDVRIRPPRILVPALPIDPEASQRFQVPAEIPVRLRVGIDGRVREIVPEDENLSAPIQEALERSARAMRFIPAQRGEDPVEAWFSMTFVYRR